MTWKVPKPSLLDTQPVEHGFVIEDGLYAAIPYKNKMMIIHNGEQLKICNNEQSARNFIKKHQKQKKS